MKIPQYPLKRDVVVEKGSKFNISRIITLTIVEESVTRKVKTMADIFGWVSETSINKDGYRSYYLRVDLAYDHLTVYKWLDYMLSYQDPVLPTVTIEVPGGVASVDESPDWVEVTIKDYDERED